MVVLVVLVVVVVTTDGLYMETAEGLITMVCFVIKIRFLSAET